METLLKTEQANIRGVNSIDKLVKQSYEKAKKDLKRDTLGHLGLCALGVFLSGIGIYGLNRHYMTGEEVGLPFSYNLSEVILQPLGVVLLIGGAAVVMESVISGAVDYFKFIKKTKEYNSGKNIELK